jgi:DNA-binding LacI/PurR family transcriptional regulator
VSVSLVIDDTKTISESLAQFVLEAAPEMSLKPLSMARRVEFLTLSVSLSQRR